MSFCDNKQVKVSSPAGGGPVTGGPGEKTGPIKYEPLTKNWFINNAPLIAIVLSIIAILRK